MAKFNFKKKIKKQNRKILNWDTNQTNIFQDTAEGYGNTVVEASPGSGKSTAIIECLYNVPAHYRADESVMGIAFNNDICNHLEQFVPPGVHVKTFHKLGFQTTLQHFGPTYGLTRSCVDVKGLIAEMLVEQEVGNSPKSLRLRKSLIRGLDLAKSTLSVSIEEINALVIEQGIETCGLSSMCYSKHIHNIMEKTLEPQMINGQRMISFADMIWLPHMYGWTPKQYDRIYVDEGQDLSKARLDLVLKALVPGGRMFVFGDKMQAIFQFAGASPRIVDDITKSLDAKKLKLSVSYRLPKAVIALARKYNPYIEAAPNAIDGNVSTIAKDKIITYAQPGTAILSRTNFHIINEAFNLIKNGVKANIQGKDIANRFLWRISCWEPRDVADLRKSVCSWRDVVCGLLEDRKRPTDRIMDEAASILRLAEDAHTVDDVQKRIKLFFKDDSKNQVKLSTCHKAKGLEWNNVILLDETFKPDKNEEEQCIYYVGLTRTKQNLMFAG